MAIFRIKTLPLYPIDLPKRYTVGASYIIHSDTNIFFYFYTIPIMIEVTDTALRQAASEGMDAFIAVFTDAALQAVEGNLTAETMMRLNADQHTLLAYRILRDEVMEGGFCQLIQNGYGAYIFDNPFAKALRLWGVGDLSKLLYAAKKIYDANRADLERERTDEEFMAMYEQYEAFDDLEDEFLENEERYTALVAAYVDDHLELFAKVVD